AAHARMAPKVQLDLGREGDVLTISAQALAALPRDMAVYVLRYTPHQTTKIKRGENRGKTLDYANVVEGWTLAGQWDGQSALRMSADVTGDKPTVVIIQDGATGPILAAARLR
ncbi:MAG: DUF1223 domain-containing protein, partial [Pseudomonadota bacterium]